MTDLDSLAFQPGQQVQCKTRFGKVVNGEVIAFDMTTEMLVVKSPPASGMPGLNDLNLVLLNSVSDVQILAESDKDFPSNEQLPNIDMKSISAKLRAAESERVKLIEAVGNGVSQEGIQLYTMLSKKYDRANDVMWKDKVKIAVMGTVIISPPYKEANCQASPLKPSKEAVSYVKDIVRKFWDSRAKQQQQQQQTQPQTNQQQQPSENPPKQLQQQQK